MDRAGHRFDVAAAALALAVGAATGAATINVPADQPTIQAGIDAAISGVDEVVVADGTYTGAGNTALNFGGKSITVRSASGEPALCTIDCQGSGRAFLFDSGEGPSAVVDGFRITGGSEQFGGGLRVLSGSDPTIQNCWFLGNSATSSGGGAQIAGSGTSPTIVNCLFFGNSSQNGAGLTNSGQASATLINCLFFGNTATNVGGGVSNNHLLSMVNCTIADNSATNGGGGLSNTTQAPTLNGCILWGNTPDQINAIGPTPVVAVSDVQGGFLGIGNINSDPSFVDAIDGNYRLGPGSPCIDAASNFAFPASVTTDLDGNPRFVDDPAVADTGFGTPPIADMGAYESQGCIPATIIVSAGTSIQAAINAASDCDTILVEPGTYVESIDFLGKGITLRSTDGAAVTEIRAPAINTPVVRFVSGEGPDTVIDGFTITGANNDRDAGGMEIRLSGPTVRECTFQGNMSLQGAGIGCYGGTATIRDCTFVDNETLISNGIGGGMTVHQDGATSSDVAIVNCVFDGNDAGRGGGLSVENSSVDVYNCTFARNTTTMNGLAGRGGGIDARGSALLLANTEMYGNLSGGSGGAVTLDDFSSGEVRNCTFYGNSAPTSGGALHGADVSSLFVRNSILWADMPDEIDGSGVAMLLVDFCDVDGGFFGGANFDADPMFVDAAAGDVRLSLQSPCVDRGSNALIPVDLLDLDEDGSTTEGVPYDRNFLPRLLDVPEVPNFGEDAVEVDVGAHESLGAIFVLPEEFETAGAGDREAAGDLDNDGDEDVAIVIPDVDPADPGEAQVFLNNGTDVNGNWLGLAAQTPFATGPDPSGIAIGFLSGDLFRDIAVCNAGDDTISVYTNSALGDGMFAFTTSLPTGGNPQAITAADVSDDGLTDLIVANADDAQLELFVATSTLGPGGVTFMNGGTVDVGVDPTTVEPGDLDNDKDIDMIVGNKADDTIKTIFFQGGMEQSCQTKDVGDQPVDLAVGDFDNNGFLDIATANFGDDTVSIVTNQGGQVFDPSVPVGVGDEPRAVEAADYDNDGDVDLAVVANDPLLGESVQVLLNETPALVGPTFGPDIVAHPIEDDPLLDAVANFAVTADMDGNGFPDIIIVSADDGPAQGQLSVLLNGTVCLGDADGDGSVGFTDLTALLASWGSCPDADPCVSDIDGDGDVGFTDLTSLLSFWGSCTTELPPS